MLSDREWDARYRQQAGWTRALREHLYRQIGLGPGQRALEVGCGTGAVSSHLAQFCSVQVFGLDLDPGFLSIAKEGGTCCLRADALHIPCADGAFDATLAHMFLLWVAAPAQALAEMRRVTRPGGWVLALAEPDYGGRIDYPPALTRLGALQRESLREQGADPEMGRKLAHLFLAAGLEKVESGLLGGQFRAAGSLAGFEQEWQVLTADLAGRAQAGELAELRRMDEAARRKGERILFVPTFYAIGQVG